MIHTVTSETDLTDHSFGQIRETRYVPMLANYLYGGADAYYEFCESIGRIDTPEMHRMYADFLLKDIFVQSPQGYCLLSLGCGRARRESGMLQELYRNKSDRITEFIGVDASYRMLEMAEQNIDDLPQRTQLWQADFLSRKFEEEVKQRLSDKPRIIAVLDATFGNVNQDHFTDCLYDITAEGDYVWIEFDEIHIRDDMTAAGVSRIFNIHKKVYMEDVSLDSVFSGLRQVLALDPSAGEFYMEMLDEKSVGAIHFTYNFRMKKAVSVTYKGQHIQLTPDEVIHTESVRVYYPPKFIEFFQSKGFEYVDYELKSGRAQFLFRKGRSD